MRIVVAVKILPDSKDLRAGNDGALDFSHARNVVSEYDLNAIEAAAQLAASQEGSTVKVLSVGPASIDESKVKKNILSRGVDELYFATNDALEHADARATAQALSLALQDVGGWDVVICGDGSDDFYAKQVDAQLAATLNVPLPAVISVQPSVAVPRTPSMKDILAAGKKPMHVAPLDVASEETVEWVECKVPEPTPRKKQICHVSDEGAIASFAASLKAAL